MASPAERVAEHAIVLRAGLGAYLRNGYWWTILSYKAHENMIEIVAEVREVNRRGKIVLARSDDLNPMFMVNPITAIADGEEPNPGFDASDPSSPRSRVKYRKDVVEALKVMLDRHLAMKTG